MSEEINSNNHTTIFVVEEDDETRPLLRQNLQRYGYHVIVALDEEDAVERLDEGQVHPDLMLVNLVGRSPEDALLAGRRIRKHAKWDGHTPLIVMAEKYGADLEGTDAHVGENDWITYPEDAQQLQRLIGRLLGKSSQDAAG
jgi:DNA-binding response OmpR family regulator